MNQISLDINKSGQIINEPVVLRVGEKDQTITVNLLKDGQPYTSFTTATFFANKPSGSIVANDPANISSGTITYTAPQALVNEFGKITNAYFLIDGKVSTEGFVIAVLQGVNISDDLNDYIPGMDQLNVIYDKWKDKLDGITRELTGIDAPKEVKNVVNNVLKDYANQLNDLKGKLNTLQTDVNNLKVPEIGGRNLLTNTVSFSTGRGTITQVAPSWDNNIVLMQEIPQTGFTDLWGGTTAIYATSEYYTLSFWAKSDTNGAPMACYFYNPSNTISCKSSQGIENKISDGNIEFTLTDVWTRYWVTWKQTPSMQYKSLTIGRTFSGSGFKGNIYMTKPMLVEGNQPMDWSPAPEDIQAAITNAIKVDVGKTITATDDTGKTVKLNITGIS